MPEHGGWFFDSVTLSDFGVVVSDDYAARRTCADLDVPVTGTIGILRAAAQNSDLSVADANGLLTRMIAAGFYSPVDRIT